MYKEVCSIPLFHSCFKIYIFCFFFHGLVLLTLSSFFFISSFWLSLVTHIFPFSILTIRLIKAWAKAVFSVIHTRSKMKNFNKKRHGKCRRQKEKCPYHREDKTVRTWQPSMALLFSFFFFRQKRKKGTSTTKKEKEKHLCICPYYFSLSLLLFLLLFAFDSFPFSISIYFPFICSITCLNSSSETTPSPSSSASMIISRRTSSPGSSPNNFATSFKFSNDIFPFLSKSKS